MEMSYSPSWTLISRARNVAVHQNVVFVPSWIPVFYGNPKICSKRSSSSKVPAVRTCKPTWSSRMRNVVAKAVEGNDDEAVEGNDGEISKGSSWQTLPAGTEEILEHLVSSLFGMALCDFRAKI